jgi:hypothetical protein
MKKVTYLTMILATLFYQKSFADYNLKIGDSVNVYGVRVSCSPRPSIPEVLYMCQLKDTRHNRILEVFYGPTQDIACLQAEEDCRIQNTQCSGWNARKVNTGN